MFSIEASNNDVMVTYNVYTDHVVILCNLLLAPPGFNPLLFSLGKFITKVFQFDRTLSVFYLRG